MKKTCSIFLAILLAIGLSAQGKSKSPKIHIDKESVDYGLIQKGSNRIRTLKVTNKGDAPLLLVHCEGTCGCTIPSCPKEPILPGKYVEISINYDTNRVGVIAKSILIKSNDPDVPVKTVPVKGEVQESDSKS